MIIWIYALFLTAGGAYNYKGCNPDVPTSNMLIDSCRKHASTMRHCRTDVSNAWRTAAWVRIPYPLQWGVPIFHMRTSLIMIFVSLVASVDSVSIFKLYNQILQIIMIMYFSEESFLDSDYLIIFTPFPSYTTWLPHTKLRHVMDSNFFFHG